MTDLTYASLYVDVLNFCSSILLLSRPNPSQCSDFYVDCAVLEVICQLVFYDLFLQFCA